MKFDKKLSDLWKMWKTRKTHFWPKFKVVISRRIFVPKFAQNDVVGRDTGKNRGLIILYQFLGHLRTHNLLKKLIPKTSKNFDDFLLNLCFGILVVRFLEFRTFLPSKRHFSLKTRTFSAENSAKTLMVFWWFLFQI